MLIFKELDSAEEGRLRVQPGGRIPMARAKIPGGWLVASQTYNGLCFVPDPMHKWDGKSIPDSCD